MCVTMRARLVGRMSIGVDCFAAGGGFEVDGLLLMLDIVTGSMRGIVAVD